MASISGNTAQAFHAEWTREPVTLPVALRAALAQEESEYGLAQQVKAVCLAHPHWHVAFLNAIVYSYCEMISDNLLVPADTWGLVEWCSFNRARNDLWSVIRSKLCQSSFLAQVKPFVSKDAGKTLFKMRVVLLYKDSIPNGSPWAVWHLLG